MRTFFFACAATLAFATAAQAADAKTYQVTGPVTELTDKAVTVQKGSEKWQIARGTATVPADVKVGSKVTITYTMTATNVVSKDAPAAKEAPKKK